jgi:hypothetical protein
MVASTATVHAMAASLPIMAVAAPRAYPESNMFKLLPDINKYIISFYTEQYGTHHDSRWTQKVTSSVLDQYPGTHETALI